MSFNFWIICGSIASALGVGLGAFGAHFFKPYLNPQDLITYETSIRYLFIHAMALISLGLLQIRVENFGIKLAGWFFLVGIFLFCGSLFLLVATKVRFFGVLTPLGGLCFISGWLTLAISVSRIVSK